MQPRFLLFSFPGIPNVRCAFGQRIGDDPGGNISLLAGDRAKAIAARKSLLEALAPLGLEDLAEVRQVHGCEIAANPEATGMAPDPDSLVEADGMMMEMSEMSEAGRAANPGLLIKTADCQPILVAHKSGRRIMAIHAGWRGNRANFPGLAIERFCEACKILPRDLMAVRGPSLGPANAQFVNFATEWPEEFRPFLDGRLCMDLWRLTRSQLEAAGIPARQVFGLDICTMENAAQFFSFRRDKSPGRQGSVIWMANLP